jgi:hypothetical protein
MTLVDPPHSQSPPREEGGRERGTEREREREILLTIKK